MKVISTWYTDIAQGFVECFEFVGSLLRAIGRVVVAFAKYDARRDQTPK